MPLELIPGRLPEELREEVTEYGVELRAQLEKVYAVVRRRTGREMERQKNLYDKGKVNCKYSTGDKVWKRVNRGTREISKTTEEMEGTKNGCVKTHICHIQGVA